MNGWPTDRELDENNWMTWAYLEDGSIQILTTKHNIFGLSNCNIPSELVSDVQHVQSKAHAEKLGNDH